MVYNKLVRDKIPEIIEKNGQGCKYRILDDKEYIEMLEKKLFEELSEYLEDKSKGELADLMEVILSVMAARGYSYSEIEDIRLQKREERGGFDKKIMLEETY